MFNLVKVLLLLLVVDDMVYSILLKLCGLGLSMVLCLVLVIIVNVVFISISVGVIRIVSVVSFILCMLIFLFRYFGV